MFITRRSGPPTDDGSYDIDQTYRFNSDYNTIGEDTRCGPQYRNQTGTRSCQWFIHDFDQGLPEGRYDLWVFWVAPCKQWPHNPNNAPPQCPNGDQPISLFSSGVNSPIDP